MENIQFSEIISWKGNPRVAERVTKRGMCQTTTAPLQTPLSQNVNYNSTCDILNINLGDTILYLF